MVVAFDGPVVQTVNGPVQGFWRGPDLLNHAANPSELVADGAAHPKDADFRYAAFLGIPYAQAPVGALRFARPRRPEKWSATLDCTEYGATPAVVTPTDSLVPEPAFPGSDILNLNVFTPDLNPQTPAPVLVYIHGGGFTSGSPSSPWYDGRSFNRDGVVTVSISYRLGFEGFGAVDGAPANRGVLDWLAALEWVQENIHTFGGDPGDVTIAGQSAGGGAVLTLLGLPQAQRLFRRAWAISGATGDIPMDRARATTLELAKIAGVSPTLAGFSSLTRQQLYSAEQELVEELSRPTLSRVRKGPREALAFGPVVDGVTVPQTAAAAITAGIGADKHLLIGATVDEFTFMADELPAFIDAIPARVILELLGLRGKAATRYIRGRGAQKTTRDIVGRFTTDSMFRAPALQIVQSRGSAPTWLYDFAWVGGKESRAIHCSDLPFWFDILDQPYVNWFLGDDLPSDLAAQMHGAAIDFLVTGDPGWPRVRSEEATAMIFDGSGQMRLDPGAYAAEEELLRL